ncbi:MAG TPA: hypothetical protein VHN16_02955 [Streptosporangiaceae bacterium]|nr:hypothetical protein [Streptosporangiaceae bacterium]
MAFAALMGPSAASGWTRAVRAAELHQLVHDSLGLAAKRYACYRSLSGGRKQRRAIALGGGCTASGGAG